jgi:hypothetical protein
VKDKGGIMTWADDMQEWQRQQNQIKRTKESREKFKSTDGNKVEWQRVYKNYLSSPIWQEIKKRKLQQVGYKCERCGAQYITDSGLQVHHLTYERVGGLEKDSDLQVVCAGKCHEEADEEREERVEAQRLYDEYERWFENWGEKKYGDNWSMKLYDDEIKMREEFCEYAYRKWCKENNKSYRAYLNIPDEFIEMLENGLYNEYEEPTYDDDFSWYR